MCCWVHSTRRASSASDSLWARRNTRRRRLCFVRFMPTLRSMNTEVVKAADSHTLSHIAKEVVAAIHENALRPTPRPREQVVEEVLARYFGPTQPTERAPYYPRMNTSEAADGAAMWARLMANSVAPTVRAVRQSTFGDVVPPFRTYPEAVAWLKAQDQDGPTASQIPYWDVEGESATVAAATDQLRTIAAAVTILEVLTPWGPEEVLMHLLCGALPVGPAKPTVRFGGPGSLVGLGRRAGTIGFHATIEVAPWQVEALPAVTEVLKKHWALEQERWLSGDDAKLADLIAVHGLPPQPGRGRNAGTLEGWDKIAKAWLETQGKKADAQQVRRKSNALRMQWRRRFQKLWPRFAGELGDGRDQ